VIIISKSIVEKLSASRPGFLDAVESSGSRSKSGHHVLEPDRWESLLDNFDARAEFLGEAEPMSAVEAGKHFAEAMIDLTKAGKKIAPEDVFQTRLTICLGCQYWNPRMWLGLGGCRICKCSKFALWLAKSKCPLPVPKWLSYEARQTPKLG